ncbi:MAG: hypothetical protein WD342_14440 [Verrucomicrobiales bacterium]
MNLPTCFQPRRGTALLLAFSLVGGFLGAPVSSLAQRAPDVGYAFPAGGTRGSSFEIQIGGQQLTGTSAIFVSGEGVAVEALDHHKMPNNQTLSEIRKKLGEIKKEIVERRKAGEFEDGVPHAVVLEMMDEVGVTKKEVWQVAVFDRQNRDPKRQKNAQLAETVTARITVASDAEPGLRDLRVLAAGGLSNPVRFAVGQYPETSEPQPFEEFDLRRIETYSPTSDFFAESGKDAPTLEPPVTVNGRILPGEVDAFRFRAARGDRIVVVVEARRLIPYLADAVPGWFQAYVSLFDSTGRELAFAGSYRFDPDPVLFYEIPSDGEYRIEVRDSIYRGREDFVYRITVGELPYLTGLSPLGAQAGSKVDVAFHGGNLDEDARQDYQVPDEPGVVGLRGKRGDRFSNEVPFQIGALPDFEEREPNDTPGRANRVDAGTIVNGRIERPGDADYFRVKGRGGQPMVFEIHGRRLHSPVDTRLVVYDADGDQLAVNDDHEDPAAGLVTHQADSRVVVDLPSNGECLVSVTDTQNQGGPSCAYRLRLSPPRPGFALRATPSTLNAEAGKSTRVTVHALRTDGFDGEIALRIEEEAGEKVLKTATIPPDEDTIDVAFSVEGFEPGQNIALRVVGEAEMDEDKHEVVAGPAEDMMQAFIYRHLVPVSDLILHVRPAAAAK